MWFVDFQMALEVCRWLTSEFSSRSSKSSADVLKVLLATHCPLLYKALGNLRPEICQKEISFLCVCFLASCRFSITLLSCCSRHSRFSMRLSLGDISFFRHFGARALSCCLRRSRFSVRLYVETIKNWLWKSDEVVRSESILVLTYFFSSSAQTSLRQLE